MVELDVRIITLDPFIAVSFHGYGASPEVEAWTKTNAWLAESRLLEDGKHHRFFGFNNPSPSSRSPLYGYDVWVTVDDEFQPTGEVKMAACSGGLYAVTRCTGVENISATWQEFISWREKSGYRYDRSRQWLEEQLNLNAPSDELIFDLFMPIREK